MESDQKEKWDSGSVAAAPLGGACILMVRILLSSGTPRVYGLGLAEVKIQEGCKSSISLQGLSSESPMLLLFQHLTLVSKE